MELFSVSNFQVQFLIIKKSKVRWGGFPLCVCVGGGCWLWHLCVVCLVVGQVAVGNFSFSLCLHASGSDFRLYDGSDLKIYLMMRWWGPDALPVCWAHRGLPVGFLLLRYSVLFLLLSPYICFISFLS